MFQGLSILLASVTAQSSKLLELVGAHTLAILVVRKFPVVLFQMVGTKLEASIPFLSMTNSIVALPVSIVSICLCLLVECFCHRQMLPVRIGEAEKSLSFP